MILKEFAEYLHKNEEESSVKLLYIWLKEKLKVIPVSDVDKVIKTELYTAENDYGDFLIIAKRDSGRKLMQVLYNFALSFEHLKAARKIHVLRPSDAKKERNQE